MSATTPTSYTAASYSEMVSGETIDVADWLEESQNLHHLYSRAGARCPLFLRTGDPFETTDTSYTQTDDGDGPDLDRYTGIVRATFFAPDGNTTLGQLEIAVGSSWAWNARTLNSPAAQAGEGGWQVLRRAPSASRSRPRPPPPPATSSRRLPSSPSPPSGSCRAAPDLPPAT